MNATFELGTASVKPGSKGYGHLAVARTHDQYVTIPVIVLNGIQDGPTLVVTCAVHGNENFGSMAVLTLAQTLDPKKMKGTFVGIPVVNVPAFEAHARVNPWDRTDLELVFLDPKREGTVSERTAYVVMNEILPRADYLIDSHADVIPQSCVLGNVPWGGVIEEWGVPHEKYQVKDEVIEKGKEMLLAWGNEYIWWKTAMPMMLHCIAAAKGIPAICSEGNTVQGDVNGIINVMKHIGMLEGKPQPQAKTATLYDATCTIYNRECAGFWMRQVRLGDRITKGDNLGNIVDPYTGEKLGRIISPADGVMLTELGPRAIGLGTWLGPVGTIMETVDLLEWASMG